MTSVNDALLTGVPWLGKRLKGEIKFRYFKPLSERKIELKMILIFNRTVSDTKYNYIS